MKARVGFGIRHGVGDAKLGTDDKPAANTSAPGKRGAPTLKRAGAERIAAKLTPAAKAAALKRMKGGA